MLKTFLKKKAFTLIELMAVVIILGVISTMTVTTINYTIKNSKIKLYNEQINRLEAAAKEWSIKNTDLLPIDASGISFFSIKKLKDEGIIGIDSVIDPRNNEELLGCLTIKYDESYNQYIYNYIDADCSTVADAYKPVITIVGGDAQFTEVNGVFSVPKASAKDYIGKTIAITGPVVKKGTVTVSNINTETVGDQYTLTYTTKDIVLDLTTIKIITVTVRDTIKPIIVVSGNASSFTMNYEAQATFVAPLATVTDNSCGLSGTDSSKNNCAVTLLATNTNTVTPFVLGVYNLTYTATDSSGNTKSFIVTVNVVDTTGGTMPTYAIKLNTSAGANYLGTWTNQSVWLGNLSSTDVGSGIKEYQFSTDCSTNWTTISGATATYATDVNTSYCIRSIDYSLNASPVTPVIIVKVDKTVPSCASSGGNVAWIGTTRTLTGTCTDGGSGCTAATVTKLYSTEINSTTESPGSVTDTASNISVCPATQTVKIDKTAPSCASSGGNVAWINTSRTLTGTCTDTGSGCAASTVTKLYSAEINSATESPGSVTDNAGLTTICAANQTVKIDKTTPSCASSGGNAAWVGSLTLTGTCTDASGSGCSGNVTRSYSTETNSTTESPGNVTDIAGNAGSCPANQTVKIDATAPTCISSGGNAAWINTSLTLIGTCTDAGSGCSGNVTKGYSTDINSTTESPGSVSDLAGNSVVCPANQPVKIDKIAPTLTLSVMGSTTWKTSQCTTPTYSDAGSGINSATALYSWGGAPAYAMPSGSSRCNNVGTTKTTVLNTTVTDNAGNVKTLSSTAFWVDAVAPTFTLSNVFDAGGCGSTGTVSAISDAGVGTTTATRIRWNSPMAATTGAWGSTTVKAYVGSSVTGSVTVRDTLGNTAAYKVVKGAGCILNW